MYKLVPSLSKQGHQPLGFVHSTDFAQKQEGNST